MIHIVTSAVAANVGDATLVIVTCGNAGIAKPPSMILGRIHEILQLWKFTNIIGRRHAIVLIKKRLLVGLLIISLVFMLDLVLIVLLEIGLLIRLIIVDCLRTWNCVGESWSWCWSEVLLNSIFPKIIHHLKLETMYFTVRKDLIE